MTDRPAGEATPAPLSGTRSEAMQRLQVGLFGLGAMILLVGLANIFITNARRNEAQVVRAAGQPASADTAAANDPLADAGVVPDMPATVVTPAEEAGNDRAAAER